MSMAERTVLLCSCEDTMRLDPEKVRAGLGNVRLVTARHLCGPDSGKFRELAATGKVTVACTAMRALFEEIAEDDGLAAALAFADVRASAGWSSEGAAAGPKMAALIAAAVPNDLPAEVTIESAGVTLIYGRDQTAIEAAERLKDRLDLTVVLMPGANVQPPRSAAYPVREGRVRAAAGHLGAFKVTLDAFAAPRPSSRTRFAYGASRDGLVSEADILIDLSGGTPLIAADRLRDGYLRADPASPVDVERLIGRAADLVGTFDKPRYVDFTASLCAHKRSRITGCTRCLDVCATGAITSAGDSVAIDPQVCAGCGDCAAVCPTGAASYAVPTANRIVERLRAMLAAYRTAGGTSPQILIHDADHGEPLIDAAARFGDGLPARTIPLAVNEITQVGIEVYAAALAYGAASIAVLAREKPRHDLASLRATLATVAALAAALGYGAGVAGLIETDDPDALVAGLRAMPSAPALQRPASFMPVGRKRDILRTAVRELHRAAPMPVDTVPLAKGAPFGRVAVRTEGCTLCLSCVSACPTRALGDAPDRPRLSFDESLCVQCGLCAATCPEKVMTLEPRLSFAAFEAGPVTVKEEEPACCTKCGKAFGVKSTIERVARRLEDQHWMFAGENRSRIDLIRMCEECRVEVAVNSKVDPFAGPARPAPRTSEDYFKAREAEMQRKIEKGEA